jgi:NAD(P)-dependent dehydrogenase (short-subunit alcohol dehydrogenase family)
VYSFRLFTQSASAVNTAMKNDKSLKCRTAFVTGAASGIGFATAREFLRRGYAVALVDNNSSAGVSIEEGLRAVGPCSFIECDVSDDDQIENAVEQTVRLYGSLDVAFNGAAIGGEHLPTAAATLENWNRVISIDLTGVFLCMRHQIRQMLEQGGGSIVNCASTAGLRAIDDMPAYVAAKHGVVGLTKAAALEYIKRGIRVNAVCPGLIDTPMMHGGLTPEGQEAFLTLQPIGRLGRPEEIAAAVLALTDESMSLVTGQALAADGGLTAC